MVKPIIINALRDATTALVAGDFVKISSGKVVKCTTNATDQVFGVVAATPASGSTNVGVIRSGLCKLDAFVQDTDGGAGYDHAIAFGDTVFLGGKVTTSTRGAAQYAVSGAGTSAITTKQIGVCVDQTGLAGVTTGDTEGKIWVLLSLGPFV